MSDSTNTGAGSPKDWRSRLSDLTQSKLLAPLKRGLGSGAGLARDPSQLLALGSRAVRSRGLGFYGRALTVLLCAYFLADLVALGVAQLLPDPPRVQTNWLPGGGSPGGVRGASLDDYGVIVTRNLFNSQGLLPGEGEGSGDLGNTPVRTALPFNLVGTVILRDELKSIATIEDKAASLVYPVRVQDEIPSQAKILSIEPRRVIFLNTASGRREFIELPEESGDNPRITIAPRGAVGGGGIERTSPNQFSVQRVEIDKALSNLNQVLTQARAVPHYENGQPAGWKLFQIIPGSIYEKLGLQNGDLLCGINGQSVNDAGKAFEMLSELKTAKSVELCVKRDGKQSNYAYEIN